MVWKKNRLQKNKKKTMIIKKKLKIGWLLNFNKCIAFSWKDSGLCIYHLVVRLNFNHLYNSQRISFSTPPCLVLYYFCASLLYSLILWLTVSSLFPYNLHLLFFCVLSIFALRSFVLMAMICAAIERDSVSLLSFSFRRHFQVFSCAIFASLSLEIPIQWFFLFISVS